MADMDAQDYRSDNAAASNKIILVMYLPECGWITLICIPRAKLKELLVCLTPVQWLRYIGSNVYGADGDIFSQVYPYANDDEVMADVLPEEEEEEPAVEENHGESGEEPAPKGPVVETTILSPAAPLEELPAEMRRARDIEREESKAKVTQWLDSTI